MYNPAHICGNGHVISTTQKDCPDKFCKTCGARVISRCEECGNQIPGRSKNEYIWGAPYNAPTYCAYCGKPYPWTKLAIESTVLALKEAQTLAAVEVKNLEDILPDAIQETPRTQLAAVRIQKAIATAGDFASDCLKQFVVDWGCELIRTLLRLP